MGPKPSTPHKQSGGRALQRQLHVESLSDIDSLLKQTVGTDYGKDRLPSIDGSQEASQAWLLLADIPTCNREVNLAQPRADRRIKRSRVYLLQLQNMKYFLANILPRLKKVSASLDQSALLVDKPWVVASIEEDEGPAKKLIFREDGRLHVSIEGEVHDGSWEYLPEANAVLIEQRGQKSLYKHAYLDEAVLALVKDTSGQDNEYYLLADENLVPDGDVVGYLAEKFNSKEKLIGYDQRDTPRAKNEPTKRHDVETSKSSRSKKGSNLVIWGFVSYFLVMALMVILTMYTEWLT